MHRKLFN